MGKQNHFPAYYKGIILLLGWISLENVWYRRLLIHAFLFIGTISLSWSSGSSRSPQSFQKTSTRSGRLGRLMVSIASTTRDAGSSAMFLGQTLEFLRLSRKQAKHNDAFNRRANLGPCDMLFLSILRRREATRVPRGHVVSYRSYSRYLDFRKPGQQKYQLILLLGNLKQ